MDYIKKTDKLGAIFTFLGIGLILAVPFAISLYYNAWPEMSSLLKGLASTLIIYFPVQIIEIFTYVPILGRGGSYLAFITGNISNLKAPAVMDSLKTQKLTLLAKREKSFPLWQLLQARLLLTLFSL
ncbi:MAG: hypothetical protein IKL61_03045 [Clostridia bacterium]|nr:hypothetical protein [Clostridia bacterium]